MPENNSQHHFKNLSALSITSVTSNAPSFMNGSGDSGCLTSGQTAKDIDEKYDNLLRMLRSAKQNTSGLFR